VTSSSQPAILPRNSRAERKLSRQETMLGFLVLTILGAVLGAALREYRKFDRRIKVAKRLGFEYILLRKLHNCSDSDLGLPKSKPSKLPVLIYLSSNTGNWIILFHLE
jgi:hypothetical protein